MKTPEKIALGLGAVLLLSPRSTTLPPFTRTTPKTVNPSKSTHPSAPKDNDVIQYLTEASGLIIVGTGEDVSWGYPKLKEAKIPQFKAMVVKWSDLVDSVGHDYSLPSSSLFGVMWAESQGNDRAVSKAGALGLMQVMPANFPAGTPQAAMFDPLTNLTAAAKLLRAAKGRPLPEMASWYNAGGNNGSPWTNAAWLKAGRRADQTSRWGVASQPEYIDTVVAASNTYILLQQEGQV